MFLVKLESHQSSCKSSDAIQPEHIPLPVAINYPCVIFDLIKS